MVTRAKQQRDLRGLYWIAEEKNYSDGWVANSFCELFGMYPDGSFERDKAPPTKVLLSWVKKNLRAYALKNKKAERRTELKNGAPRIPRAADQVWRNHMRSITGRAV
jgi:hypothetical protein